MVLRGKDVCTGGAIAAKLLAEFGIRAFAYVSAVGAIEAATFDEAVCAENPLGMPDAEAAARAAAYLKEVMRRIRSAAR